MAEYVNHGDFLYRFIYVNQKEKVNRAECKSELKVVLQRHVFASSSKFPSTHGDASKAASQSTG